MLSDSFSNYRKYCAKHGPRRSHAESTTIATQSENARRNCATPDLTRPFSLTVRTPSVKHIVSGNTCTRSNKILSVFYFSILFILFWASGKVNKAPSILFSFLFCRWPLEKIDRLYTDVLDIGLMNSWASDSTRGFLKNKAYIYIFFVFISIYLYFNVNIYLYIYIFIYLFLFYIHTYTYICIYVYRFMYVHESRQRILCFLVKGQKSEFHQLGKYFEA